MITYVVFSNTVVEGKKIHENGKFSWVVIGITPMTISNRNCFDDRDSAYQSLLSSMRKQISNSIKAYRQMQEIAKECV